MTYNEFDTIEISEERYSILIKNPLLARVVKNGDSDYDYVRIEIQSLGKSDLFKLKCKIEEILFDLK